MKCERGLLDGVVMDISFGPALGTSLLAFKKVDF